MNILSNNALIAYPKFQHLNRGFGRKAAAELEKANKHLSPVVGNFMVELFSSPYNYETLYKYYLEEYRKRVQYYNKKLVFWKLDEDFFHSEFKPLESPPSPSASI